MYSRRHYHQLLADIVSLMAPVFYCSRYLHAMVHLRTQEVAFQTRYM